MNKLLLSTLCAGALTSAASAFTIDVQSLAPTTLGSTTYNVPGYSSFFGPVTLSSVGGPVDIVAGTGAQLDSGESLVITFPSAITSFDGVLGNNVGDNNVVTPTSIIISGNNGNSGSAHTVAFSAVTPEPSSTALLGLGGLALILRRRK